MNMTIMGRKLIRKMRRKRTVMNEEEGKKKKGMRDLL